MAIRLSEYEGSLEEGGDLAERQSARLNQLAPADRRIAWLRGVLVSPVGVAEV